MIQQYGTGCKHVYDLINFNKIRVVYKSPKESYTNYYKRETFQEPIILN